MKARELGNYDAETGKECRPRENMKRWAKVEYVRGYIDEIESHESVTGQERFRAAKRLLEALEGRSSMTAQEFMLYFQTTFDVGDGESLMSTAPRAVCKDGFSISIKAGRGFYSEPREYLASGKYTMFEIGFPDAAEDALAAYVEGDWEGSDPTACIYAYVPLAIVDTVIAKHGGIVNAE